MCRRPRRRIVLAMDELVCQLERAVGRHATCPGASCPFWIDSCCILAGLRPDLDGNPSLAGLLLGVRRELSVPGGRALVPPGLRD
jgi:hypothetical protein